MKIQLFNMVRTQGNRGRGASSQGPPTSALPPPSPGLALILRSLEAINETIKRFHLVDVEVEPPPYGLGKSEALKDYEGGPPPREIIRELQKIKLPEFFGGRASERAEKERPRWEERVVATRFMKQSITDRKSINPLWWIHQVF
jgi:hypothetical protein